MKKNIRNVCIVTVSLIVVVAIVAVLLLKLNETEEFVSSTTVDSELFAIVLTHKDGTTEVSNSSSWPSAYYEFDAASSYCNDSSGNPMDVTISYDATKNSIKFYTTSFTYCYIYFKETTVDNLPDAFDKDCNIDGIIDNGDTEDIDGLWEFDGDYRFVGTNPDNYICFGTSSVSECTSKPELYMYRIIGIFKGSDGNYHFKLIKKEALDTAYAWNSDNKDVDWVDSTLYSGLNGDDFLTNTTYSYMQNSTWLNKIYTWTWNTVNTETFESTSVSYNYTSSEAVYYHEMNNESKLSSFTCYGEDGDEVDCEILSASTVDAKIGLMYVSDYLLSLGEDSLSLTSYANYSTLLTGWMHLANNDSSAPSTTEYTISRMGKISPTAACLTNYVRYSAWIVLSSGSLNGNDFSAKTKCMNLATTYAGRYYVYKISDKYSVRPTFYLDSSVVIQSGSGSETDPYMIATSNASC